MGLGKTYSTKYLLDSNNSSGVAGQVLSTTSTGIDWADANTLPGAGLWLENGNDIYNSNSGNVGIGTTSPTVALQIQSASSDTLILNNSSNSAVAIKTDNTYLQLNSGGYIQAAKTILALEGLWTYNTKAIRSSESDGSWVDIMVLGSDNILKIGTIGSTSAAGDVAIYTDASEKMRITSAGNVGIGTTVPQTKLDVDGTFGVSDLPFNTDSVSVLVADETLGADLITNGDFATNTDWTLGTGWSIANGKLTANNPTSYAQQGGVFASGVSNTYKISLTVSNYVSGYFTILTGGSTAQSQQFSANGNYTIAFNTNSPSSTTFHFTHFGSFNGSIENVSVQLITSASNQIQKRELGTGAFGPTPVGAYLPLAGGTMTGVTQFNDHTQHGDQVLAKWGAGNDLTIQHNGTNSGIANSVGNLYISNHADDKDIIFESDNGSGASVSYFTLDGSTTHAYFSNPGNVGIGTTSPGAKLDVLVGGTNHIQLGASALGSTGDYIGGLYYSSNKLLMESFLVGTGYQDILLSPNGGNVGIGTTSPVRKLHIQDTTGNPQLVIGDGASIYSSIQSANSLYINAGDGGGGSTTIFRRGTSLTESMRIDSSGNVGIGTTSPGTINGVAFSSVGLHVNKGTLGRTITEGSQWGEYIMNHSGESANRRAKFIQSKAGDINIGSYDDNGTQRLHARLDNNGTFFLGNTSTAYQTVFFDSTPGTVYGNGTLQISPLTSPGSGIAQFTTNFADRVGGGTTKHNVRVGGTVTATNFIGTLPLGQFLPLAGGTMTGNLVFNNNVAETWKDNASATTRMMILNSANVAYIGPIDTYAGGPILYGTSADVTAQVFYTGATERMRIDSTGNVGIGTTTPTAKLQVYDDRDITSNSTNKGIRLQESTGDWLLSLGVSNVTNTGFAIRDNVTSTYPFVIRETTGNVGIGTTSPDAKLDVIGGSLKVGDTYATVKIIGTGGLSRVFLGDTADEDVGYLEYNHISNYFRIGVNAAERMRIDSSGNVGIGVTGPGEKLEVGGNIQAYGATFQGTTGSVIALKSSGATLRANIKGNNNGLELGVIGNKVINFEWDGVTKIQMKSTGRLGIGTGTAGPDSLLEIEGATNSSTSNLLRLSRASQGSAPEKVAGFYSGTSGEKGYITVNNFGTAYNTSSDYRLKENIKPIEDSVERLMSLKPCSFNFISEEEDKIVMDGFIAHEAKDVVPEAVTGIKDAVDEKGNPMYQGIDQSKIVPLLTAALQQALQRIEILEQKINN
jgi:hypothetical protein